jgi:hypothetical protein
VRFILVALLVAGSTATATGTIHFHNRGEYWNIENDQIFRCLDKVGFCALFKASRAQSADTFIDVRVDTYADARTLFSDVKNGSEIECNATEEAGTNRLICDLEGVRRLNSK